MDFIKKLFSSKSDKYKDNLASSDKKKDENLPIDEQFVTNYVNKGGKFFYPDDMDDFKAKLLELLSYLNINEFATFERSYYHFLKKLKVPVKHGFDKNDVLLGGCENLIASDGAILTTSLHTGEYRNSDLPIKRVFIALSNQILPEKDDALININNKYEKRPSNIQTMSVFSEPSDSLSATYWYDTYLFLIEN